MALARLVVSLLALAGPEPALPGGAAPGASFDELFGLVKPQPGESLWAKVPWLTRLDEAQERAASEDRPIFLWRAGGGGVLGRA